MRAFPIFLGLVAIGAAALFVSLASSRAGTPPAPPAPAAPKVQLWEYHCSLPPGALAKPDDKAPPTEHEKAFHDGQSAHPSERFLNYLGDKGWELVAIDPNNGHYCFKRPK